MSRVYIICGMSGSGKDTLANALLEKYPERFVPDVGYTTRPMRPGEIDGKTYHFRTEPPIDMTDIFDYRSYETCNGVWHYWHKKIENENKQIIAVSTLNSVNAYAKAYGADNICVLQLAVDPVIAFRRAYNREFMKNNPDYEELARRFISDCEPSDAYINENVQYTHIDANGDIEQTLKEAECTIERPNNESY